MPAPRLVLALGGIFAVVACQSDRVASTERPPAPTIGAAPALTSANGVVATTVGQSLTYDATKGGTAFSGATTGFPLTYRVAFDGTGNGYSAVGGVVTGRPAAPGVTWATISATDSLGRAATDRFAFVAFTPGLATPTLPTVAFSYADAANPLPAHYRAIVNGTSVAAADNTPADDPITDAGAALGRVLFYDMRLSASDGLSCAGCHSPFLAFGDTPPLSVGFAGGLTGRHTPGLTNARFYARGHFFWDERAPSLEAQVLGPIQSPVEMGMTLDDLVAKVTAAAYYPPLFQAAFGSPQVTSDRISHALAQYVRSLVSTGSKYDRAFTVAGATATSPNFAAVFTPQELQGEALFRSSGCASCHATAAQISDSVHNVGLDVIDRDVGAGRGTFKAPSLRNVAARPPYMHDGRFMTLEQVVAFFDTGVQANPNLDARLKSAIGAPIRLNLTAAQRAALVAFLNTLTDSTFLVEPRFANPFAPLVTTLPIPVIPPPPPTIPMAPPAAPATGAVSIQGNAFRPRTITVARGAVVTWTNLDNSRHGVNFLTPGPSNTPIFTSGTQQLTMPATPGTYNYQCLVHGAQMPGTIIVQ